MTIPESAPLYARPEFESAQVYFEGGDAAMRRTASPEPQYPGSASSSPCDSPLIESAYGGDDHFAHNLSYHQQDVTFVSDSSVLAGKLRDCRASDDILGGLVASSIEHNKLADLDAAAAAISAAEVSASALGIDLTRGVGEESLKSRAERERELTKEIAYVERRQSLQSTTSPLSLHAGGIASCPPAVAGSPRHSTQPGTSSRHPGMTVVNPFAEAQTQVRP